jgi:hypothetical protein
MEFKFSFQLRQETNKAELLNEEVQVELDQIQASIDKHKRQDRSFIVVYISSWPRGLMDKALLFESKDCGFESHRGRFLNFVEFF